MRIKRILSNRFFIYPFIFISLSFSGFQEKKINSPSSSGVFTYMVNDKVFTMENMKAYMRTTTGGRKQLSLSNDRFVKFFFINPQPKKIDLSTNEAKQAVIRYNEPGTNFVYRPKNGFVNIESIDDNNKTLTGEFEMEMILEGKDKVIRITKGKLINIPIISIR
jgi:hypothetical protein